MKRLTQSIKNGTIHARQPMQTLVTTAVYITNYEKSANKTVEIMKAIELQSKTCWNAIESKTLHSRFK